MHQNSPVGAVFEAEKAEAPRGSVRPAPSSRTRSRALGEEKERPATKQSPPNTVGELLTVLVIRKTQTLQFKEQWAWVLRARQGGNHLHSVPQALGGAAHTAGLLPCWGPEASRVCWALPAILLLPLLPTQS